MIHVLPPEVANRIAAGEVVERPASVVRELADNAIDAGAKRIDVEVENGGINLIRITDDGCGMPREDAELCIQRHATSKIHEFDDLHTLMTKGFRGEALAAIASVSQFELKTRRADDEIGTLIQVNGGEQSPAQDTGAAAGTSIAIRHLFYNTPARRKFLKKPSTELSHVMNIITYLALAHESIHFTVTHGGRRSLDCPAVRNRAERIRQLFGKETIENLIPIGLDTPAVSLSGLISRPTLTKNGAQQIYFFVNNRFVRDRLLHRALINGYRNLIPSGRYPVAFLFYDIDPHEIDINVHPTKQEIKFAKEDAIFSATYGAIRQAWDSREEVKKDVQQSFDLAKKKPSTSYTPPPKPPTSSDGLQSAQAVLQPGPPVERATQPDPKPAEESKQDQTQPNIETETAPVSETIQTNEATTPASSPSPPEADRNAVEQLNRQPLQAPEAEAHPVGTEHEREMAQLIETVKRPEQLFKPVSLEETGTLRVIGQMMNSYILAEDNEGLYIIDQHAAHERVMFERFFLQAEKAQMQSQSLLIPLTIDFTPDEAVLVAENIESFTQLGFEIEPFGPKTFAVHAMPSPLNLDDGETLIHDLVGEFKKEGSAKEKRDRALHTMACRASVKFGDRLSMDDMKALIEELERIPRRNVCPHGRPNILYVTDDGLRKAFKRTGF